MFCHVPPIFLFCIACTGPSFRSRFVPTAGESRGRHEMSCFVMFRGAACLSVPGLSCIVPPSRSPPPGSGTLFRAYRARAPAPVGAGAACAPDCACTRPCARDPGRRAHLSRRFLRGFFAPARTGGRGSPARMPLLFPRLISERTSRCQSVSGNISTIGNELLIRIRNNRGYPNARHGRCHCRFREKPGRTVPQTAQRG